MASIPQEQYLDIQYAGQEIDPLASKLSVLERRFDAHIGKGGNVHASATQQEAGFMSPEDKEKLDGVENGATQNSTDAFLLNRGNHQGEQPIESVTGLRQELNDALAGGSNYRGLFPSLAALEEAIPLAVAGNYADVDEGEGIDAIRYIWDDSDQSWVSGGAGEPLTAPQVKALYESNPNTNALTNLRAESIDDLSGQNPQLAYSAGVTLERATQTFVRDNVQYRIKDPADLPYTLTGDWATESGNFVSMGDSGLRQDLAGPQGAEILGLGSGSVASAVPAILPGFAQLRATTRVGVAQVMGVLYTADPSDTTSAESLPMVVVGENGMRWKWNPTPVIDARIFGAVPGATADNTGAIQKAIDYCLTFSPPKSLLVSDTYRITSSLMVDQPVEGTTGEFQVIGINGGGFFVDTATTMFSSRLPYGDFLGQKAPPSEYLHFKNIRFEAATAGLEAYVVSDKFFRLTSTDCNFRRIKFLKEADYLQSLAFLGKCQARSHSGVFMKFTNSYDLDLTGLNFEISGAAFVSDGLSNVVRLSGLYEGSTGPFWSGSGNMINLHDLYFEKNGSPEIIIPGGDAITIDSVLFALDAEQANPSNDYWPIVLGADCKGVTLESCISTGGLVDNLAMGPFSLRWASCSAANRVLRKNTAASLEFAAAGTDQASARPLVSQSTIITSGTGGVRMPSALTTPASFRLLLVNSSGSQKQVYPATGQRFLGFSYNQPINITSGSSIEFFSTEADAWIAVTH